MTKTLRKIYMKIQYKTKNELKINKYIYTHTYISQLILKQHWSLLSSISFNNSVYFAKFLSYETMRSKQDP